MAPIPTIETGGMVLRSLIPASNEIRVVDIDTLLADFQTGQLCRPQLLPQLPLTNNWLLKRQLETRWDVRRQAPNGLAAICMTGMPRVSSRSSQLEFADLRSMTSI